MAAKGGTPDRWRELGGAAPGRGAAPLSALARRLQLIADAVADLARRDGLDVDDQRVQDARELLGHPALQRLLGPIDGPDGGPASAVEPDSGPAAPRWEVQLLGTFAVTSQGRPVTPPRGNGATIVKLVALRGRVSADTVIDLLWPDAPCDVGRARLRNTLSRLRQSTGDLVRRQDDHLSVHPSARVDAIEFVDAASAALRADRGGDDVRARGSDAVAVLATFPGELLPGDRYVDWFDEHRDRVVRHYLELADAAADGAECRGAPADAAQFLEAALAVDPFDADRAVRAARNLVASGHRASARWAVERALSVTRELGLAPCPELRRLAGLVSTGAERIHPSFRSMTA